MRQVSIHSLPFLVVMGLVILMANSSSAQLAAFPGAEGAAWDVTGGRGGDVYHVVNLNDSGAGSLREGITSASGPRTIVFDVAGTINLQSRLRTNGKSNLTIAGQTAPAGGITIAKHEFNINNSNNIVVQHLRFRPGDRFPATHAPFAIPTYNPDAIGITGSTDVMIDHITASWGVDETVSVTSGSDLVTVQWSTMSQGLYNANHTDADGIGHSFGSLLNAGTFSFHHNLYAQTKSRHPRAQWNASDAEHLVLDWVNNVVFNPRDEFGNSDSDDPISVNMVGNYGIRGTDSGATHLMNPADMDSTFYVSGNYMDSDRDLTLDGSPVDGSAVFETTQRTIVGTRFDIESTPEVTPQSAEDAYIQVVSRAGANRYRDEVDKRLVRTVLSHLPGHINTQADWGGWPTLPTGSAAPDANSDGVPDAWASTHYGDTSTPLNSTLAPDGYSYLEKYIHSLTPHAYGPAGTVEHTISTAFGTGADAQVNENGGGSATSSGDGLASALNAHWAGAGGSTNQAILMKFDLSEVVPGTVTDARLELTAASAISGTHTFMVYGVEQDADDWDWTEGSIEFATAPGLALDNNSGTLGVNNTFTTTSHPDNPDILNLGQISIGGAAAGDTISLTNPNLAVYLNLAAYYQGDAWEDEITLILQQVNSASAASFHSKEGNPLLAPRLVVDAIVDIVTPGGLDGDYNNNDVIDAADYTVWRDAMTAGATILTNDPTPGVVDESDFTYWRNHFGETLGNGSGQGSAAVPEPASMALLLVGGLFLLAFRSRLTIAD